MLTLECVKKITQPQVLHSIAVYDVMTLHGSLYRAYRNVCQLIDFNDNFINDSPTHQGCPPTATAVIGGSDDDARHSVTIAVIWPNVRNMIKTNDMY